LKIRVTGKLDDHPHLASPIKGEEHEKKPSPSRGRVGWE
jgi:hypothetical protein